MISLKRKVHTIKGSYFLYLPKEWCEQNLPNENAEILIDQTPFGLLLRSPKLTNQSFVQTYTINLDLIEKDPDYLQKIIIAAYVSGADRIRLESEQDLISIPFRDLISEIIRQMFGFEIVHEEDHLIELQSITEPISVNFLLKRAFENTLRMLDLIVKSLERNEYENLRSLARRDDEIDRFRLLMERYTRKILVAPQISSNGNQITAVEGLHYLLVIRYVERIADHVVSIGNLLSKSDFNASDVIEKVKHAKDVVQKTMILVLNKKIEHSMEILNRKNTLMQQWKKKQLEKRNNELTQEHFNRILEYCTDIVEVVLDFSVFEAIDFEIKSS